MAKPNVDIVQGAFSAQSISIASCEHGSVWVRLHDRAGNVFAFGCVDTGTALALDNQLREAIAGVGRFHCDILH